MISTELIREKLSSVSYPGYSRDIVSFGLVKDIQIENKEVRVKINLQTTNPEIPEIIFKNCQKVLSEIKGINHPKIDINIENPEKQTAINETKLNNTKIEGIKHIIAIASGKGGVGKSTITVNLATALSKQGAKVGICDCDLYGPSIAYLLGNTQSPESNENDEIIPQKAHNISFISMGGLLSEESPVIVRGPLATRYTQQFLRQSHWGELDYLLLDLPPGTGDIQLTIVQTLALSGAIIVTTPQELALIDARKAVSMFKKVNVPLLGLIENMSWLENENGKYTYPFGKDGGKKEARKLKIPLLNQIPLEPLLQQKSDAGIPIGGTDEAFAQNFQKIAKDLKEILTKE